MGEEEGSGWEFVGDMGLDGDGTEAGATGEEDGGGSQGEREDPVVVVVDGGGFGDKGGESRCSYDVDDMLEGTGGKKGFEGNKGRENHYGWDFIFSGEEEG